MYAKIDLYTLEKKRKDAHKNDAYLYSRAMLTHTCAHIKGPVSMNEVGPRDTKNDVRNVRVKSAPVVYARHRMFSDRPTDGADVAWRLLETPDCRLAV